MFGAPNTSLRIHPCTQSIPFHKRPQPQHGIREKTYHHQGSSKLRTKVKAKATAEHPHLGSKLLRIVQGGSPGTRGGYYRHTKNSRNFLSANGDLMASVNMVYEVNVSTLITQLIQMCCSALSTWERGGPVSQRVEKKQISQVTF
ncbi:hypothetical protein CDAR_533801 [Caerostris darwini]|uniref:Uncharacterized protein n=1 Tax=Caerostris darwini TaxID=1538125 RepID=A0AAV4S8B0_9ARAC|nr:hypothetical protein CDAR_533801 [Caerostris darwini]